MIAFLFAAMVGLTALAYALLQARARLQETSQMAAQAQARREQQVERIKKAARVTLGLARELGAARRRRTAMEISCDEVEERLRAIDAVDRRVFVLDDRHAENDLGWLVKIANAEFAVKVSANLDHAALDSWRRGRRFLVWGPDEQKVREKIAARFPQAKGFSIRSVQRREE